MEVAELLKQATVNETQSNTLEVTSDKAVELENNFDAIEATSDKAVDPEQLL